MPRQSENSASASSDRLFFLGFVTLIFLVPLAYRTEAVAVAYYPKLLVFHAALLFIYIVWMWNTKGQLAIVSSPFVLPVVLFLAIHVVSAFQAVNRVETVVQISHQAALTFLFLALLSCIRSGDISHYLKPVAASGAVFALIGMVQYLGLGLLWIPSAGMPSATFGYRNFAAMAMLASIPMALFLFLEARRRGEIWFWSLACAFMLIFLIYTRTRGAWIGLGGGSLIFGLAVLLLRSRLPNSDGPLWSHARIVSAGAGVFAIIIFSLFPPRMGEMGLQRQRPEKLGITQTMASVLTAQGDKDRLILWNNTWKIVLDHPFLGVGAGNWQFVYPLYDGGKIVTPSASPRRPHNDYLWIFSELGLPGILAFLWILGLALYRAFRLASGAETHRQFWLPLCLGLALLALMGHSFFSFPRERITPSVFLWATLAFIAILDAEQRHIRHIRSSLAQKTAGVAGLILLILCLWLSARALAFDRHYARAIAYTDQQAWDGTVREATAALSYGIFDPQILLLRGVAHLALGDYIHAAEDNQRCLIYHPYFVNALNNLGMAYNGMGAFDKAVGVLMRLLEIDPDHLEVHANLGVAYRGMKRFDEALAAFRQAMSKAPGQSEFQYHLAVTYEQQGDLERAAAEYAQILGSGHESAKAHYRLGVIHQKREIYYKAVHEFQQTLLIDPAYLPAYFGLGEVYTLQGDTTHAIASYRTFLEKWGGDARAAKAAKDSLEKLE